MTDETLGDLLAAKHALMHTQYGTWSEEDHVWHVKETEHWRVLVMPMLFNYRLAISSTEFPIERAGFTAGWCYDKGPSAFLAALAYDPETEVEPVGYKKRAMDARGGSLAVTYDPEPHLTVTAHVTDRHRAVEDVYCGTQPEWAWPNEPWKRMMRKSLLADRTSDPQGWRVTFTTERED